MVAKRFFLVISIAVSFALPLSDVLGEEHAHVPRQAALPGLPNDSPLLDVTISGKRVIGVGAYGKIVVGDAAAVDVENAVQVPTPIDVTLTSIVAGPDAVLIAAGHEATLLLSVDGGDTWEILTTDPTGPPILRLIRLREAGYVAVGGNGLVLRGGDRGGSWKKNYITVEEEDGFDFDPHLFDLIQMSNGRLVATGERGFVFLSDDLGQTWSSAGTGYNGSLFSIAQIDNSSIVAFGMSGNLVRSVDNGNSWVSGTIGTNDAVFSAKSVDGKVFVSGIGGLFTTSSKDGRDVLQRQAGYQVAEFIRGALGQYFLATSVGLQVVSLELRN